MIAERQTVAVGQKVERDLFGLFFGRRRFVLVAALARTRHMALLVVLGVAVAVAEVDAAAVVAANHVEQTGNAGKVVRS